MNLVPIATPSSYGTVKVKSVYEHYSQADDSSVVLNMQGARSLTDYMSNDTQQQILDRFTLATNLTLQPNIEADNLTVRNQIIYMPSTGPTNRLDAVASNMFFTVVEENGLMGYSQIWGVGSNTGNPGDEVELKVGKTWEMICDSNVFKLSKGGVVKHIFS